MRVLILFETAEGQSRKIARFAAAEVGRLGHTAQVVDLGSAEPVSFEGVDRVILAAPVHQRRHPREFEAFVAAHARELGERRTLMLSVSLSAAFPEGHEEARDYLVEMKMRTGFEPDEEALVAGAVRIDRYDYFALQVVRFVVLRGKGFDPAAGDHEFTDWDRLARSVADFVERA